MYHNFKIGDRVVQTRYATGRPAGSEGTVVGLLGEATLSVLFDEIDGARNVYARLFKPYPQPAEAPDAPVAPETVAEEVTELTPGRDDRFICDHVVFMGGRVVYGPASLGDCRQNYSCSYPQPLICRLVPTL